MEIFQLNGYMEFAKEAFNVNEMFQTARSKVLLINLMPGQAIKPHTHPRKHLIIHVITGNVLLHCGNKTKRITPELMVWAHGDDFIGFTNDQDGNASICLILNE